jgi:hypothetical protein
MKNTTAVTKVTELKQRELQLARDCDYAKIKLRLGLCKFTRAPARGSAVCIRLHTKHRLPP